MQWHRVATGKVREGLRLLETEHYEAAVNAFSDAVLYDPNYARAYRRRAEAYRKLGRLDAAEADEVKATELGDSGIDTEGIIRAGGFEILIGGGLVLGGIIGTVYSYTAAEPGGTYYVFWGLIVFGAVGIFKGLAKKYGNG